MRSSLPPTPSWMSSRNQLFTDFIHYFYRFHCTLTISSKFFPVFCISSLSKDSLFSQLSKQVRFLPVLCLQLDFAGLQHKLPGWHLSCSGPSKTGMSGWHLNGRANWIPWVYSPPQEGADHTHHTKNKKEEKSRKLHFVIQGAAT